VGTKVGASVGLISDGVIKLGGSLRCTIGASVIGFELGDSVGTKVGASVGLILDGIKLGDSVGYTVGASVGNMVDGIAVGSTVGLVVRANVGFELVGFAQGSGEGCDDGLLVEYEAEAGVRHFISVDFHDTISQGSDIPTN
jgi:hypothetical protein